VTEASGIPSWARVGVRVVWVDCDELPEHPLCRFNPLPALGEVCTITSVSEDHVGAWLSIIGYCDEFAIECFRPLVSDSEELGIETVLYRKAGLKSKSPVRESERT
jgi:hypothetical protein